VSRFEKCCGHVAGGAGHVITEFQSPDACNCNIQKYSRHAAAVFEWYLRLLEHSITEVEEFYVVNCAVGDPWGTGGT